MWIRISCHCTVCQEYQPGSRIKMSLIHDPLSRGCFERPSWHSRVLSMLPIHVFFTTTICSNISHVILYVFRITFVSPILCNTGLVFRVISLFLHPFGKFNLGANSMSFCMFSQFSYFGGVCVISAEVTSHAHDWLFISRRFVLQARSILQILSQRMSRLQSCPQDCTQIWTLPS